MVPVVKLDYAGRVPREKKLPGCWPVIFERDRRKTWTGEAGSIEAPVPAIGNKVPEHWTLVCMEGAKRFTQTR